MGRQFGETRRYDTSVGVQETVMEEKSLYPNVDFYTASVLSALGLLPTSTPPLFAVARMSGWTAHIREQYADNRLIRPDSEYIGPEPREWRPLGSQEIACRSCPTTLARLGQRALVAPL